MPTADAAGVLVSAVDGYVVAFNLTGADVATTLTVPHDGGAVPVYAGTQAVGSDASTLAVTVPAGDAVVLAPRATVATPAGQTPSGVTVAVDDARSFRVSGDGAPVVLHHAETGATRTVGATPSGTRVTLRDASPFPVADHALSTLTFPASVLPAGMTSPSLAVDGDAATSWVPGPDGRMVTDLGAPREIGTVVAAWERGGAPESVVSVSDDGLTFTDVGTLGAGDVRGALAVDRTARYVALSTSWRDGDPGLTALRVLAPGAADPAAHPGSPSRRPPRCGASRARRTWRCAS